MVLIIAQITLFGIIFQNMFSIVIFKRLIWISWPEKSLFQSKFSIALLRVFFSFLLKLNSITVMHSHHPSQRYWSRTTDICYSVKDMLKLLAFKWLLNELLVETEWSVVVLIWWFVSNKIIRSFLKLSFLTYLFKRFPL